VRQALAEMVPAAEAQGRDTAKQHLDPAHDGHHLAQHSMAEHDIPTDPAVDPLIEVKLQVRPQHDLDHEHEHQGVGKRGVDVFGELAALVGVSHEEGQHGENRPDDLDRDVPSGADDL